MGIDSAVLAAGLGLLAALLVFATAVLTLLTYRASRTAGHRQEEQRRILKGQDRVLAEHTEGIQQIHVLVNDRLAVALAANAKQDAGTVVRDARIDRLAARLAALDGRGEPADGDGR